jgi:hypothetical protein
MSLRSLALLSSFVVATAAGAEVSVPTVTGPITAPGNPFVASTTIALGPLGYDEAEFFVDGTATGFTSTAPLGGDGKWTAAPATTAAYKTRILVRRPSDASRFNGTVIVEWLNVSGGLDVAPDWIFAHTFLMREGYVWVGASAQKVGVDGGANPLGLNLSLKGVNPARYGSLVHPGDTFSYDMFSQVAAAVRGGAGVKPLGDLTPKHVIAVGESQSATRLVTYVNAIHPIADVYDGYLIHSRGGGGSQLSQDPEPEVVTPTPVFIRDDLDVPVLTFESETDLMLLGFLPARQADTRRFRLWEVPGTSHADLYQLVAGWTDAGPAALDTTYSAPNSSPVPGIIICDAPVNQGPHHYVLAAAIAQLDRWIRNPRKAARRAPRLSIDGNAYVLDGHGNVKGGIRTPALEVPILKLSGLGQTGAAFCRLFGTTVPFDAATLQSLYPSHERYVKAVKRSAKSAVRKGFLLKLDAGAIVAAADASGIGG